MNIYNCKKCDSLLEQEKHSSAYHCSNGLCKAEYYINACWVCKATVFEENVFLEDRRCKKCHYFYCSSHTEKICSQECYSDGLEDKGCGDNDFVHSCEVCDSTDSVNCDLGPMYCGVCRDNQINR